MFKNKSHSRPLSFVSKEDAHEALLKAASATHNDIRYVFYPFDLGFWRDEVNKSYSQCGPLTHVIHTFNEAGYHIHAYEWNAGGFSLWIEKIEARNEYGDTTICRGYEQEIVPVFIDDLKSEAE